MAKDRTLDGGIVVGHDSGGDPIIEYSSDGREPNTGVWLIRAERSGEEVYLAKLMDTSMPLGHRYVWTQDPGLGFSVFAARFDNLSTALHVLTCHHSTEMGVAEFNKFLDLSEVSSVTIADVSH